MRIEKTKIAVPITGTKKEEILDKASLINDSKADMIEWRSDYYEDIEDLDKVLKTLEDIRDIAPNKPILFTLRSKDQGGIMEISHDYYMELNREVSNSNKADYIDIELGYLYKIHNIDLPIVGSYHNFKETPSKKEILSIFKEMEGKGADILKVAVMPNSPKDVLTLLDASYAMYNSTDRPIIAISMGELGKISRITGGLFGSFLTFASLGEGSAPGQMSIEELSKSIEILSK